jgi:hypothetical protein
MPHTNIFKLFFHHDQRLDNLNEPNSNTSRKKEAPSLADFMKPDPTYSKFYLTGTDLAKQQFGLNVLNGYTKIIDALEEAFDGKRVFTKQGESESISAAISSLHLGEVFILTDEHELDFEPSKLHINHQSNVGHLKTELREVLEDGYVVVYKEQAKDGFDLHIFSKKNVYNSMFYPLQKLVPETFRFFSINGKKFRTERHFYFETWTLEKPPHGFEEVFPETVL